MATQYADAHFEAEAPTIRYNQISPDHPLMRPMSRAMRRIREGRATPDDFTFFIDNNIYLSPWEAGKAICMSKEIDFSLKNRSTGRIIVANNGINKRQDYCIRHALQDDPTDTYIACKALCCQPAHAEIMGVVGYLLDSGILGLDELHDIFPNTVITDESINFGVVTHSKLKRYITANGINLGDDVDAFLYGHKQCCDQCASVLLTLGIQDVHVADITHSDEKALRDEIHADIPLEDMERMQAISAELTAHLTEQ